jgi:hypothetical protein
MQTLFFDGTSEVGCQRAEKAATHFFTPFNARCMGWAITRRDRNRSCPHDGCVFLSQAVEQKCFSTILFAFREPNQVHLKEQSALD